MDETILLDQKIEDRFFRAIFEYSKLLELTIEKLSSENFSTPQKGKLWRVLTLYHSEFQTSPTSDVLKITAEEMFPGEQSSLIIRLINRIERLPAPEWEWIVKRIDEYVKTIHLQKALYTSSHLLKESKYVEAESCLVDSIRYSGVLQSDSKNDLDLSNSDLYEIAQNENAFCCPTRIYALDDCIRGLYRKELFLIMAPLNVGKSWATVHLATSSLLSGKHVLYFTLEMSRERVLQRVLQNISGTYTPKYEFDLKKEIEMWQEGDDEKWSRRETEEVTSLFDIKRVSKNIGILKKFGGVFSVREYGSGVATVNDIERDITSHDVKFGKIPDVVIVDGLMDIGYSGNTDVNRQRLGLTKVTRRLRQISTDYNCAVVTTHQGNRESIGVDIIGTQHTGESLGISQVADTGISLNQTKAELQTGKMRLYIMRARNNRKGQMIEMWQNLEIGQFCQVSKIVDISEENREDENPMRRKRKRVRRNEKEKK